MQGPADQIQETLIACLNRGNAAHLATTQIMGPLTFRPSPSTPNYLLASVSSCLDYVVAYLEGLRRKGRMNSFSK